VKGKAVPDEKGDRFVEPSAPAADAVAEQSCRSMHENVELWEDVCVCEPEPRWQAVAEESEM
jgi:hypothetical protein